MDLGGKYFCYVIRQRYITKQKNIKRSKFYPVHAMVACKGGGAGNIALFIINLDDRGRSVVKATPLPLYSLERTPISID
jgi:hypothetical protein